MERKTDLRVLKTRNAIKSAFKKMILEREAADISIKELTERAMIHRKTFYLHYTCIGALYEDLLSELAEDYFAAIDQVPADAPFTEVNRAFFEFMAAQEPYMEKLVCDPSYREFADKFFMVMLQHNRGKHNPYAAFSPAEQNIINTFLGTSSVNIYRRWVQDKKSLPLSDLIDLTGKLFYGGISSVL
mgnify:FL=1